MTEPKPVYIPDPMTVNDLTQKLLGLRSDALSIAAESERMLESLGVTVEPLTISPKSSLTKP
jgi:hypothetical protein